MTYSMLPTFIVLFSLAVLGYWRRDRVMLMISGLGFVVYGFTIWSTTEWASILVVIIGIYLVVKAFWDNRSKNE